MPRSPWAGGRIGQALTRDTSATDPTRGWNPSQADAWSPPPTTALPRRLASLDAHSTFRAFPSRVRLWLILAVHCKASKQGTATWSVAIDTGYCACRSFIHRSVCVDWGKPPGAGLGRKSPGGVHGQRPGTRFEARRLPRTAQVGHSRAPKGGARRPMVGGPFLQERWQSVACGATRGVGGATAEHQCRCVVKV